MSEVRMADCCSICHYATRWKASSCSCANRFGKRVPFYSICDDYIRTTDAFRLGAYKRAVDVANELK
jgi:hypothetical protein